MNQQNVEKEEKIESCICTIPHLNINQIDEMNKYDDGSIDGDVIKKAKKAFAYFYKEGNSPSQVPNFESKIDKVDCIRCLQKIFTSIQEVNSTQINNLKFYWAARAQVCKLLLKKADSGGISLNKAQYINSIFEGFEKEEEFETKKNITTMIDDIIGTLKSSEELVNSQLQLIDKIYGIFEYWVQKVDEMQQDQYQYIIPIEQLWHRLVVLYYKDATDASKCTDHEVLQLCTHIIQLTEKLFIILSQFLNKSDKKEWETQKTSSGIRLLTKALITRDDLPRYKKIMNKIKEIKENDLNSDVCKESFSHISSFCEGLEDTSKVKKPPAV
jgi:hypothetical protein